MSDRERDFHGVLLFTTLILLAFIPYPTIRTTTTMSTTVVGYSNNSSKGMVFKNGTIVTFDDTQPAAEAVLIRDDRIIAVGTEMEIATLADPDAVIYDLQGRTLLPGFIDTHAHRINSMGRKWTLDLSYEDLIDKSLQYG